MAFGSITKYHKEFKELNLNPQDVANNATKTTAAAQQAASASIFEESFGAGSSSSTTTVKDSSNSYDYEAAMDKALSEAKTIMAVQTGIQAVSTIGQVALGFLTGDVNSSNIFSNISSVLKSSDKSTEVNLTNDLDSAMKSYSSRQSEGNAKVLQSEVTNAQTDVNTINAKITEQNSIVTQNKTQKETLDAEMKELESAKNEQQKSVDDIKNGIIESADAKIAELDADDKAQNEAITASQTKVTTAQTKLTSDLAAQDSIISSKTPDLQAVKTTTTNVNGKVVTQTVPDTAKRTAAKTAIDNANKEKERLQKEFDDLKAQEEEIQANATQKIEENAKARQEQESIKANPQSDELTAAREKLETTINSLNEKQTASAECKSKIDEATLLVSSYQQQLTSINSKITQAQSMLSTQA